MIYCFTYLSLLYTVHTQMLAGATVIVYSIIDVIVYIAFDFSVLILP